MSGHVVRAPQTRRGRRIAIAFAAALLVIAFAVVFPKITQYGVVWSALRRLSWAWILVLLAAAVANILTFAPPWQIALPGLGFIRALRMTQASTAFSLVVPGGAPAGMAVSFAMLRSWGFAGRPVGLAVAVTGIWNQLATFAFPVVAVTLLTAAGNRSTTVELLAAVGLTLSLATALGLAAVLRRPSSVRSIGEVARRLVAWINARRHRPPPSWDADALVRFRHELLALLYRRWLALTATTLANQLTGYLMLDLALRATGSPRTAISLTESFSAWSVGRLLVSLPLTPGGIGVVELSLTGILIGFGGAEASVVSAVLLYRGLSTAPTLLLGLLSGATWRLAASSEERRKAD